MKYSLYLASGSATRKDLLTISQIPFELIHQTADESLIDTSQPMPQVVQQIAELKMNCIVLPSVHTVGQEIFVLTADTLTLAGEPTGYEIFGKPQDREHAKYMLRLSRKGTLTGSAFCIQKMVATSSGWQVVDRQFGYDEGWALIDIDEASLDFYLDHVDFLEVSGAIKIRGLCEQFTKEIRGSYSAIMGLPMYQLRQVLKRMNFFD